jgi:hypothetical protein
VTGTGLIWNQVILCKLCSYGPTLRTLNIGNSYMQPGVMHQVFTLEDSVSKGGMCYLPFKMELTLKTLVQLHWNGQLLSNSDYVKAPLSLFRLIGYYSSRLRLHGFLPLRKEDCHKVQIWKSEVKTGKEIYEELLSGKSLPPFINSLLIFEIR